MRKILLKQMMSVLCAKVIIKKSNILYVLKQIFLKLFLFFQKDEKPNATKLEKSFIFSKTNPIDKNIWNKITNAIDQKGILRIKLSQVNAAERIECNRIIDYNVNLLAAEFNRKVKFHTISRTPKGYRVKLQCSKNDACETYWYIDVLTNNNVKVNCKCVCGCSISEKSSNFYLLKLLLKINLK